MVGRKANDYAGKKVGGFFVIERVFLENKKTSYWLTECLQCGVRKVRESSNVKKGTGCASCAQKAVKPNKSGSNLKEYSYWRQMKRRCYLPTDRGFKYYGQRGIQISAAWKDNFWQFYKDMGPCLPGYSIERKDVNGDYCESNCCWIPRKQQALNRRSGVYIEIEGVTRSLKDWLEYLGVVAVTYYDRKRRGMTSQEALMFTRK